jgi:hypothetical protein
MHTRNFRQKPYVTLFSGRPDDMFGPGRAEQELLAQAVICGFMDKLYPAMEGY